MKVMSVYTPFFTNHLKYDKDKKQTYGINPNDKKEVDKNKSFYTKFSQAYLIQKNLLPFKKYPFKNGRISFGKPQPLPQWDGYSSTFDIVRFIRRFDLLKHPKYTDISEMYEKDEYKRKNELYENKAIRAKNFSFLDNIGDFFGPDIFVKYYRNLTGFPNLKETTQKINDEFKRTIGIASTNTNKMFGQNSHVADVVTYGYDEMCSVGLGYAWPGSDLDKAFIIIEGSSSPLKNKEIVNRYRGQLWENMDTRILSINHYAAFPNVYTKKQVMDNIDLFDSYTKDYTEFDKMIAYSAINYIKDPIKRAQFNLELSEKLPGYLKEDAKNFAYFIETLRECCYWTYDKAWDKELSEKMRSSKFCQMSNVSGIRYHYNKYKNSSELKPKLKARKNVEKSFENWNSKKQYNFIKNVIKNMCGDGEDDECFECPDGTRQLMLDDMLIGRIPVEKYPKILVVSDIDN